jgi:hypothetical protein
MSASRFRTDDECILALREHGSVRKAAKALGVNPRNLFARKARWVKRGFAPEFDLTHPVADGQRLKGASTLYREDGTIAAQWVKSSEDHERLREMLQAAFAGMADGLPRLPEIAAPPHANADLLALYLITDYHLGALAWPEETRSAAWDMAVAEKLLMGWFRYAVNHAPEAETAVFAQLGDFLHFDGLDAVTPEHRNLLDADTRFQKLVRVAYSCVRAGIAMMLEKHQRVHVIMAEGNHDPASSAHLREGMRAIFEDNPRVTVDTSPDPYYCVEHGATSLFFHHGHKRKPKEIDDVFAAKFRPVFGRTKYSYAHMGHQHHKALIESPLMVVEQHRTLAAPDAYATRGGWISGREAPVIAYSKRRGEVGRLIVTPEMVMP